MSSQSQFFGGAGGYPVLGDVIETAATSLAGGQTLLALDGSTYTSVQYPDLFALLDTGAYTQFSESNVASLAYGSASASGSVVVTEGPGTTDHYFISTDKGVNFSPRTIGTGFFPLGVKYDGSFYYAVGADDGATDAKVYRSSDGSTWNQVFVDASVGSHVFTKVDTSGTAGVAGGETGGGSPLSGPMAIYSSDTGATWSTSTVPSSGTAYHARSLSIDGSIACLVGDSSTGGGTSGFTYISSNGGQTYVNPTTNPLVAGSSVEACVVQGTTVYIANNAGQLAKSTDSGVNFSLVTQNTLSNSNYAVDMTIKSGVLHIITSASNVVKTSDDFATTPVSTSVSGIATMKQMAFGTDYLVVAGFNSIFTAPETNTSFTLPARSGDGQIRDRIVAEN